MKPHLTVWFCCAAIASTVMAGAFQKPTSPKPTGETMSRKSFEFDGTWIPVKAELGGQAVAAEQLKPITLILDRGRYELQVNGKVADQGDVKLVPQPDHSALNVIGTEGPNKGKTYPTIYELTGDTLTICYNLGGEARPTAFKTDAGAKLYLVTYKRKQN